MRSTRADNFIQSAHVYLLETITAALWGCGFCVTVDGPIIQRVSSASMQEEGIDMSRAWIIDVLADLHSFAQSNNLPKLAAQLEDTQKLAVEELARPPNLAATNLRVTHPRQNVDHDR